jgi:uncharacterized membrane protein YhaH (DUF805 family)
VAPPGSATAPGYPPAVPRNVVLVLSRAGLVALPLVLAFRSGGYFDQARIAGAIAAWALVAVAVVAVPGRLPRSWPGRLALSGLAGLTLWTAVSLSWAPLAAPALDDVQRLLLYLGVLLAATLLLGTRASARRIEPAVAAGCLLVTAYGLSERLVPGLVELERSVSAGGRLEQPLTYWNAQGLVAALGLLACVRLAGDLQRPDRLRLLAAGACAPLGMGLYLAFSRGAIGALAAGLFVLLVLAPAWPQVRAAGVGVGAGVLAGAVAALLPAVESLEGGGDAAEGAIGLTCLLGIGLVAAGVQMWAVAVERRDGARRGRLTVPRLVPPLVGVLVVAAVAVAALSERGAATRDPAFGADPTRLASVESSRYAYWRVALAAWADRPLTGTGTAGFRVEWLRERDHPGRAQDAHSLYVETLAELGLVGLGFLLAFLAGAAVAARRAHARDPALVAGLAALAATWAVRAALDWDWEMPAVTIPALVVLGALIAHGSPPEGEGPGEGGGLAAPAPVPATHAAPAGARGHPAPHPPTRSRIS